MASNITERYLSGDPVSTRNESRRLGADICIHTATTCSSGSPAINRIKVTKPIRKLRVRRLSSDTDSRPTVSTVSHEKQNECSPDAPRLLSLIDKLSLQLWRRDDTDELINDHYNRVKSCAASLGLAYYNHRTCLDAIDLVAMSSVLIAFKAAVWVPGEGRVKMGQLLDAYSRISPNSLHNEGFTIKRICQIEMEILCLNGFQFD
jgi:hypothetical protein